MKRFNKYTEHTIHNENGLMYGKQTPSYQLVVCSTIFSSRNVYIEQTFSQRLSMYELMLTHCCAIS